MLAIVLYIVVPILCLFGIRGKDCENNVLSKDETLMIRGIGMLFIIFTHMVKENICTSTYFFYVSGVVGVGVCFLVSGYGLHMSYKTKDKYLENFFGTKILRLLLPFMAAYSLYFMLKIFRGENVTAIETLNNLLTVTLPGVTFWYLKIQFLLYAFFYISYRFVTKINYKIFSVIFLSIGYIMLAKLFGLELFWYNSCLFFSLGLILAEYQSKILPLLRNKNVFLINGLAFTFLYLVLYYFGRLGIDWLFDMIYMFFFAGLAIWFVQKKGDSWALKLLGYYSIEVYLIHTVIGGYFDSTQPLSYILLPVVSVIIGIPIHQISTKLTNFILRRDRSVN